jgi:hypothetical protein
MNAKNEPYLNARQRSEAERYKTACNNPINGGDCYGDTYCNGYSCEGHFDWTCKKCNWEICSHCAYYKWEDRCPGCGLTKQQLPS